MIFCFLFVKNNVDFERGKGSLEVFRIWYFFFDFMLVFLDFEVFIRILMSNICVFYWSCYIGYVYL